MTIAEKTLLATVVLEERGLAALLNKVEALNKRALRHGMETLDVRVVSSEAVERTVLTETGKRIVTAIEHTVDIAGCEPCINGFRLLARVEFNDLVGTLVHTSPAAGDDFDGREYRTIGPICEHCNTKRYRKDVFVLEGPDGCRKVVARNCLADYIRSGDAEDLARWAEFMDCVRSAGESGCDDDCDYYDRERSNPAMSLVPYLRVVAMVKRTVGWMGRTAARESYDDIATADIAGRVIYGRGAAYERWMREMGFEAQDGDNDYVDRAVEWAAGLDCNDSNEYRHTIGAIARAGVVDMRTLDGYAASILIAYDKHCEREIEYAARKAGAKRKVHFGDAKKRYRSVRVKCVGLHSFEGLYGVTTIVRFEHYPNGPDGADKAILVWFASGDRYNEWRIDDDYAIDFTVKDHDDHEKYGAQTKINRVKDVS